MQAISTPQYQMGLRSAFVLETVYDWISERDNYPVRLGPGFVPEIGYSWVGDYQMRLSSASCQGRFDYQVHVTTTGVEIQ
jgi:hypothetical protein